MSSYDCSVLIGAPAAAVFAALTTRNGIRGWWTTTCEVGKDVGAESTFHFGDTRHHMRVERLQPCEVRWQCVPRPPTTAGELPRPDEWTGTTIVFRLVAHTPASTLLEFEHIGLGPQLNGHGSHRRGWDHFLKRSLRRYLENGRGEPYEPAI